MSKGSIFLQYLCNLFHFYLLGWINNELIPEDCITNATYQTFEYSITQSLYIYRYIHIYIYIIYIYNIYIYITLGKLVNPSNPHLHPNFEKFSKFVLPDALKILIHSLVLQVFCFLRKKFSKLLKFTLQNTLF